jgi:hypothetical protein
VLRRACHHDILRDLESVRWYMQSVQLPVDWTMVLLGQSMSSATDEAPPEIRPRYKAKQQALTRADQVVFTLAPRQSPLGAHRARSRV